MKQELFSTNYVGYPMKKLMALVMAVLPFVGWTADVNETNIPVATIGAVTTNDYIRILTNCSVSMANGKTRLLKIGDLLSLVPTSSGGAQVFTNSGELIWPAAQVPPDVTGVLPGPSFFFRTNDGALWVGRHITEDVLGTATPLTAVSLTDSNDVSAMGILLNVIDSEDYNFQSSYTLYVSGDKDTGSSSIVMGTYLTNYDSSYFEVHCTPANQSGTYVALKTNGTTTVRMDANGLVTANGFFVRSNTTAFTLPTLPLGAFGYYNSNGISLWKFWNTNGTTEGYQLP